MKRVADERSPKRAWILYYYIQGVASGIVNLTLDSFLAISTTIAFPLGNMNSLPLSTWSTTSSLGPVPMIPPSSNVAHSMLPTKVTRGPLPKGLPLPRPQHKPNLNDRTGSMLEAFLIEGRAYSIVGVVTSFTPASPTRIGGLCFAPLSQTGDILSEPATV
ncbi:hypothetical protein B0H13DRAFT_2648175 [Mycena leptocephala]|nr:hypothetical protein B0H13DRAFT_2648175 [Mycena leptocephala]